jgi:hypothetical protein
MVANCVLSQVKLAKEDLQKAIVFHEVNAEAGHGPEDFKTAHQQVQEQ